MMATACLSVRQTLTGPLFNAPMQFQTVMPTSDDSYVVGLFGLKSERFRRVTLPAADLAAVSVSGTARCVAGDGTLLRLGIQAHVLSFAYEFDLFFGLAITRVDALPHQVESVYDYLSKLARVRFLLADNAGAGKTIMASLSIRQPKLHGLCDRILMCAPAHLAFQWQRYLKEKFNEKFLVIQDDDIRVPVGVNRWLEQKQLITSLDLAKRLEILPGLRQPLHQQSSLALQAVGCIACVLIRPHPERAAAKVQHLWSNPANEAVAIQVVTDYERSQGRQVFDVYDNNLGYELTGLDLNSGTPRLIEVNSIGDVKGGVLLTPHQRRVAQDRRGDRPYVVNHRNTTPWLREPYNAPARFPRHERTKVWHHLPLLHARTQPRRARKPCAPHGGQTS